jgi:hypothetical protein
MTRARNTKMGIVLIEAPPSAYFVHNTYLDPSVHLSTLIIPAKCHNIASFPAINGGTDSNAFYQPEEGEGHQPHNKTCCYDLHDGYQPESSAFGFQASTKDAYSKEKYSGICGLTTTAGKSGSLSMLCNMGQEDGETQFSNCEVNVF